MERLYPSSALGPDPVLPGRVEQVSHLTLGGGMVYKTRVIGKKQKSHIWTGKDTACTMWSTGGLMVERDWIETATPPRPVCHMCRVNWEKTHDVQ